MKNNRKMGVFAHSVYSERYSLEKREEWHNTSVRVPTAVFGAVADRPGAAEHCSAVIQLMDARQFLPGGRYIYAAGREVHQVNNCLLLLAEDSREGWANHYWKHVMALSTGAGVGSVYSMLRPKNALLKRSGGVAGGAVNLAVGINEGGRTVRQGGDRRAAMWGGLHWWHEEAPQWIKAKDWPEAVRQAKGADWNFPAQLDYTNISTCFDDEFFAALAGDGSRTIGQVRLAERGSVYGFGDHRSAREVANEIFWATAEHAFRTGDPGFSIDILENYREWLRNACVPGETEILTDQGYRRIDSCLDAPVNVWNGHEWSEVRPKITGYNQELLTFELSSGQTISTTLDHTFWTRPSYREEDVAVKARDLRVGDKLAKFRMPVVTLGESIDYAYTQGFISGDGMDNYRHFEVYGEKHVCIPRFKGRPGKRNQASDRTNVSVDFDPHAKSFVPFGWDLGSRLDWFAGLLDSDGSVLKEGGVQIGSVDRTFLLDVQKMLTTMGVTSKVTKLADAGKRLLPDGHGGKQEYFCRESWRLLVGAVQIQELCSLGLKCERLKFDHAPQRDASQFVKIVAIKDAGVRDVVYCFNEPKRHLGCFNGVVTGQCTEVSSMFDDDSDICNIGSLNLARFETLDEFVAAVRRTVAFLVAGSEYSDLPYPKVGKVRDKNRRLGLGLMGVHEWLLKRGKKYGPDAELGRWLEAYAESTRIAHEIADAWGLSRPVKTRAIAPTGTISIVAETSSGIEPLLSVAYKRRVKKGDQTWATYVVDPVAQRLIEEGVRPENIETAYSLSESLEGVERRISFQAWMQQYVDHGIASTVNLAPWGSPSNNESTVRPMGEMLLRYMPKLRGITFYPDGSRPGGQPITQVPYEEAVAKVGEIVFEQGDICDITKGASCGS